MTKRRKRGLLVKHEDYDQANRILNVKGISTWRLSTSLQSQIVGVFIGLIIGAAFALLFWSGT